MSTKKRLLIRNTIRKYMYLDAEEFEVALSYYVKFIRKLHRTVGKYAKEKFEGGKK